MLTKVKTETLQRQVYQQIRDAIIRGHFAPGEPVVIRRLADELGTSPMPVREAIHSLVSEGALEAQGNRSLQVPELTREKFQDLVRVRSLVEPQAVALATENLTAAAISQLKKHNNQLFRAIDQGKLETMLETNRLFHFTVYEAARSPLLLQIIDSLWLRSGPYLRALFSRAKVLRQELGTEQINLELLEAFSERDAESAKRIRERDIRQSAAWFEGYFDAAQDDFDRAP